MTFLLYIYSCNDINKYVYVELFYKYEEVLAEKVGYSNFQTDSSKKKMFT